MSRFIFLLFLPISVFASLCLAGFALSQATSIDHSGHVGEKIHESTIRGYRLAYHLLVLPGKEARHLMVYIVDPAGKPVSSAKVGYLVIGPNGAKQKVMAMAMKDAFGGDVNFTVKGIYTIKTKAVAGNIKLLDRFTFEIK
ncbi:MAG: hypothetical protein JRH18_22010 [Deltaproteobacteria bacterium]|nr:hypothetical protein [Deltaproteobacteria bacterium]MBW2154327.1 hypothetical protein [Deltaproteobacteria bacterium]